MDKMQITIKNLGAVKEGIIDIKPLTIFIGPNNTGKTWTAYAITSLFSPYMRKRYVNAYLNDKLNLNYKKFDDVYYSIITEGNGKIDLEEFFDNYFLDYLNDLADSIIGPK